jgi:hypothetical protein
VGPESASLYIIRDMVFKRILPGKPVFSGRREAFAPCFNPSAALPVGKCHSRTPTMDSHAVNVAMHKMHCCHAAKALPNWIGRAYFRVV